jgi:drug/metabolite transporter (DMT)-like permease
LAKVKNNNDRNFCSQKSGGSMLVLPSQKNNKTVFQAYGMVLMSAVFGGAGFVFMKNALDVFSIPWFIFWRFFITVLVLAPFLWRKILDASRQTWKDGLAIGVLFLLATLIQSDGIARTGAGRSAFICSTGIVMIPILESLMTGKKPSLRMVTGCLLCFIGVGILTWPGMDAIQNGTKDASGKWADLEVFIGTIVFALRTVFLKRVARRNIPNVVSFVEFIALTLMVLPIAAFYPLPVISGFHGVGGILYTALMMNIAMIMVINNALRFISPTSVTVIRSTEAIYGALFGCWLLGEELTTQLIVSGAVILSGVLIVVFPTRTTVSTSSPE